ncbi:hypothetical protein Bhyg_13266 [Pseudolycoriella hygida]|uniref:Uncharacterized protein n=1 Tax=Pseudolycoriella hygida TaxID=35572 RepID=A0A9Q0MN34_9DIPT|nr:hypothetical protein Bhyg_13266 [Pseudolycoriella hygida]
MKVVCKENGKDSKSQQRKSLKVLGEGCRLMYK